MIKILVLQESSCIVWQFGIIKVTFFKIWNPDSERVNYVYQGRSDFFTIWTSVKFKQHENKN